MSLMPQLDLRQLAAKVSIEHGIRVDPDDPIMAVVTLNRLVLEQAANDSLRKCVETLMRNGR